MSSERGGRYVVISKKQTGTAERVRYNSSGGVALSSGARVEMRGTEGVKFGKFEPGTPPQPARAEVQEIRMLTPADEGCDWREGGALREGMIWGKTYRFEVVKFRRDILPRDYHQIKWWVRYDGENGVVEGPLGRDVNGTWQPATGKTLDLQVANAPDICGRGITIYAFIQSRESGGHLNVWVHYRFRFFSRHTVKTQVDARAAANGAYLINQGSTSLCGMANIFYILAKTDPAGYRQMALKLHQTGTATHNSYTIEPGDPTMYDTKPSAESFPARIPEIDWIVMASTRSKESSLGYTGEAGQDFSAINYPSILAKLKRELLGLGDVVDRTSFTMNPNLGNKSDWLIQMQKDFQAGYHISILIDSDMLSDSPTYLINLTRWHWIVYEGGLFFDEAAGTYDFSWWCWGQPVQHTKFRARVFNTNFYGYIKGK